MTDRPAPPLAPPDRSEPRGAPGAAPPEWLRLLGWGVLAVAVALVHNRLWATPNLETFSSIADSFGSDPCPATESSDYLMTNVLLPALGAATGLTEPHRYATMHLAVLVIGLGVCVALTARRFGYLPGRTLLVLVAVAPGVTTSMQWLGQPDALTFPLGIASVLVRRWWSFGGVALLLGLTHPEQAVIIVAVAAAVRAVAMPPDREAGPPGLAPLRPAAIRLGTGLAVGWVAVLIARAGTEVLLRATGVSGGTMRSDYLGLGLETLWTHHTQDPAALVWFLWGPLWLVVAAVVIRSWRRTDPLVVEHLAAWGVVGLLALLALLPVLVTLDQTRVYAMITAPLLAPAAILLVRESSPARDRLLLGATAGLLVVALVVPGGFTAGTAAWATQIPVGDFLDFLSDGEHPGDSMFFWLLSPFDFVFPELGQG